jgi:uncharacterized membrane protein
MNLGDKALIVFAWIACGLSAYFAYTIWIDAYRHLVDQHRYLIGIIGIVGTLFLGVLSIFCALFAYFVQKECLKERLQRE